MRGATARKPRPSTRDRLIDAAFRVVARDGLDAASVKSIALEAGALPGLLHYHFESKEALLDAALVRGLDSYLARTRARREAAPKERQLDAYFDSVRQALTVDRDLFRVRLALSAKAMANPELARRISELNASAVEEMALTFASAQGEAKPQERHYVLAATLKAAFDGVMLAWINNPAFPIEGAGQVIEKMARGWLED